jgi:hypothetical protein
LGKAAAGVFVFGAFAEADGFSFILFSRFSALFRSHGHFSR